MNRAENEIEEVIELEGRGQKSKNSKLKSSAEVSELNLLLHKDFERHYERIYGLNRDLGSLVFVNDESRERILVNLDSIDTASDLLNVIGCDISTGGVQVMFDSIQSWISSAAGQHHESVIENVRLES